MKEYWFERHHGRLVPIHWKGWVSGLGLFGFLFVGLMADSLLRQYHPALYFLGMAPLCAAGLAWVWVITGRIR